MLDTTEAVVKSYLNGIYNTIFLKDVMKRGGITNIPLLESIVKYAASSVAILISTNKISDTIYLDEAFPGNYLRALADSYILYKADSYDIKRRQHLKTLGKYYIVDIASF